MTVYVTDGDDCQYFLWADTTGELLTAAAMAGVMDFKPPFIQWEAFKLTAEQWAYAIADGATVTDKFGPAYHYAKTWGKDGLMQIIEAHRRRASRTRHN